MLEALDQAGLLVPLLPEWERVRSLPQRNSLHRFTVDRHSTEAAAAAAALTRRVARPDLLLLAALLHDIGKGRPEDHSERGRPARRPRPAPRLGLDAADVAVLVALVRHHLLLPDVATRRDLDDPATARASPTPSARPRCSSCCTRWSRPTPAATGPAAWSAWKASLVADLVRRTGALLAGAPPPAARAAAGLAGGAGRGGRVRRWRRARTRSPWWRRTGRACCRPPPGCSPCTGSTSARRRSSRGAAPR